MQFHAPSSVQACPTAPAPVEPVLDPEPEPVPVPVPVPRGEGAVVTGEPAAADVTTVCKVANSADACSVVVGAAAGEIRHLHRLWR